MTAELEIQEIIKKNLPQQVGDVLKLRLEQASLDEKAIVKLRDEISLIKADLSSKESLLKEYERFDKRNLALDQREDRLKEREFNLELTKLQIELEAEKDKSSFAKSISMGLVRNIDYRKSVFDSENQTAYMSGDKWVVPTPVNKHFSETKTAD